MASTGSQHQDAAVGGVGLALGIADMVTDNKTLTKIGTYLGAAGPVEGLAPWQLGRWATQHDRRHVIRWRGTRHVGPIMAREHHTLWSQQAMGDVLALRIFLHMRIRTQDEIQSGQGQRSRKRRDFGHLPLGRIHRGYGD